jgi:uncharacterized protein
VDTGLSALFDYVAKPNTGHALETVVLHECMRRGMQLAYVRTAQGYEVDFLATRYDGQATLIQVCADINAPQTLAREIRALQEAKQEHPHATCLLITLDAPTRPVEAEGIKVMMALDWLLDAVD